METLLKQVLENYGPVVAIVLALLVIAAGLMFRYTNWFAKPDESTDVALGPMKARINDIDRRVERIDGQMSGVVIQVKEVQKSNAAMKEEVHVLHVGHVRFEEQLKAVQITTGQTRHGVARIEDIMLRLSAKGAEG